MQFLNSNDNSNMNFVKLDKLEGSIAEVSRTGLFVSFRASLPPAPPSFHLPRLS